MITFRAAPPLLVLGALVALTLAGCAPLTPARAELVIDVGVPDGSVATTEQLDAAALVVGRRLSDAGIPAIQTTRRDDHVVVRFGEQTTDADLAAAEQIAAFSSRAAFRSVLLADLPTSVLGTESAVDGATGAPVDGSDLNWVTPELRAEFDAQDCTSNSNSTIAEAEAAMVACHDDGSVKYVLGPVEIDGTAITSAVPAPQSTQNGAATGQWVVTLEFDAAGTDALAQLTARLVGLASPRDQFAVVLDGKVVIAPAVFAAITDGRSQISGTFDEEAARVLAGRFRLASLGIETSVRSLTLLD